jgi:hypothetical protein
MGPPAVALGIFTSEVFDSKKKGGHRRAQARVRLPGLVFLKQLVYFVADGAKVVHPQVYDRKADVGNMVQFLQAGHGHIPYHPAGHFGFAQLLECRFYFSNQAIDLGGWNRSFAARDADAPGEFLAIELLASSILFDDQGRGEERALVGAEALLASQTLTPSSNSPLRVVGGINDPGIFGPAVRAPH